MCLRCKRADTAIVANLGGYHFRKCNACGFEQAEPPLTSDASAASEAADVAPHPDDLPD